MSLARAIETGDLAELPSRRDEDWRWSDIRALVRVLPAASPAFAGDLEPGPFDELAEEIVEIVNGRGPAKITVADGEKRAVALRYVATDAGSHASRFAVRLGAGSELVLFESHQGEGGYVTEADLAITLGQGARLERIVLASDGEEAIVVSRAKVELSPAARFAQTVVTNGARRQRLETRVAHQGGGASTRLDGLYLMAGKRHGDITTVVIHESPDGTTDQLTKGVATDQGRGVFQGRIEVRPGADRTDARMGHHALVLSDRAEVDAKPELEIYADDVSCSHGNTVGALDDEALFYARQRGIPEAAARAMLTEAFLGAVIDRIEHEGAREAVRGFVARHTADLT
ncbi:MAG TPA: Fe-S cluster assembly protein SufD [Caulobacteraceae bacterium]|nr:Fe-S cluster assembly protein SufD [Caulobacteraceae bacterium]